jgi:HEAT repeat protein
MTPESVQSLLNSVDYGDRLRGINQLRQLDPQVAFTMIQPLVTDRNVRVRYAAVSQLDPLGKQDLKIALDLLRDRLLNDPEIDVKAAAADSIGGLQLTTAFEDLEKIYYQIPEWILQVSILATLGELGDPRGFELLKAALDSDNTLIKTTAVSALGELGNPEAIPLLIPFVNDEDWHIRYRLAQSLGRLGGKDTQAILEQLAQDPVEPVALEANHQLSQRNLG